MKKRTKELIIIIPLVIFSGVVIASYFLQPEDTGVLISDTETQCQEGWIKYELQSGILCSKTELSQDQIDEYGQVLP